jgi:hypothetical protein
MAIKGFILKELHFKGRSSFSLIEVIFVIVITGLLASMAFFSFKDNRLISDYQVLKHEILNIKTKALGYQKYGKSSYQCIVLDKDILNNNDNRVSYKFKSEISITGLSGNTLCFDYLGRAFDGEVDINMVKLLHNKVIVTLNYKNKEKNITIYPFGGAIN